MFFLALVPVDFAAFLHPCHLTADQQFQIVQSPNQGLRCPLTESMDTDKFQFTLSSTFSLKKELLLVSSSVVVSDMVILQQQMYSGTKNRILQYVTRLK